MLNMKKTILGLSLAAFLLSSCSDFLEEPVRGQQDLSEYFKTEDECKQQITGCYHAIFYLDSWWQIQNFYVISDMCTDDMWYGNTSQEPGGYKSLSHYTGDTQMAADLCQAFWQYRYKGIFCCNVAINRIPGVDFKDESLKKRYIAEAKFLRALFYFDLVKNFGGVPLITDVKMPEEIEGITRASVEETYAFIEKDLKEAIPDLPRKNEYAEEDLGRATQGAAQGYLAKVFLYQEKYTEAEARLDSIINVHKGEYRLLDDFGHVWDMAYNNSEESLFEVQTNNDTQYNLGLHMPVFCGSRDDSGWSWGLPTSNLEKAFLDEEDDIRLKWTIIKNGDVIPGDEGRGAYNISTANHKSCRVTRKLYIPESARPVPYDATHIPLNYRLLRYADILLMYAEVENALGKDEQAREALNEVRARVDLPEISSSGTELRDDIRNERRLELALESNRLYDLRRWKTDDGKPYICSIMGPNGSFVKYNQTSTDEYEVSNQKEPSNKGFTFNETRDLLFPIPISEITMSNNTIVQNPGY